ncbi:BTAD domain-containing putative transcriptional regulator [Kitasatospora sp. NPDC091207]|uniref:BTAD domain-containing putative transcriptional regulator n=1 Tax=Kitasatospora sp. NPDC091207 TaxID=3364083 RepID=UPI00382D67A6
MHVGLLGPVVLDLDAGPVAVGGPRLRALLARLALDAGRAVRPEVLAEALWAGAPPADPANALQSLVSRLRRVLGGPGLLTAGPAGYRLTVEAAAVDSVRFEHLARAGRHLLDQRRPAEAAATLREALVLWRGPALADVREAPFAEASAERLGRARLAALADRIEADLTLGPGPELVAELESLTADHPLHEQLHAQLIRALAADGRGAEALAAYQRVRDRLTEAFGSDPGPRLRAAHLAVLRGDLPPRHRSDRPAAGRSRPHGNLDAPLTSFVGRRDDLARVVGLLDRARLVTLVGPGGAGKTRLASAGGHRLTPSDGVWFVALAPVGPDGVAGAVLDALRTREAGAPRRTQPPDPGPARDPGPAPAPGEGVLDRLIEELADDDLVLVLDNCEHVVEAAATLAATLLARCPRLRILATSREPLRIDGESLHPVVPLELPVPGSTAQQARACAAVRLFQDRAAAVRPGFTLDGDALTAVVEICRRLDGLPLAIELAAAQLRTLPIEAVTARLDDRFRLLTGGSRTALPRHRTLRAVVAWSWDLLPADERALLERLAVVPGSFTEDAALAVAGPGQQHDTGHHHAGDQQGTTDPHDSADPHSTGDRHHTEGHRLRDVRELLTALVDKSLLHPVWATDAGELRHRMLETIREYGLEQLSRHAGVEAARSRHLGFLLDLVESADPRLRTRDQLRWLARLSAERDNLLAAIRRAITAGDTDTAVRFGAALSWFWSMRGNPPESLDLLGAVLELPGPADPVARALVVVAHALGTAEVGRPQEAAAALGRIGPALEGVDRTAHPLLEVARSATALTAPAAPGPAEAAAGCGDGPPDPWSRSFGWTVRGRLALRAGDLTRADHLLTHALSGFEELGERWGLATTLSALGSIRQRSGDPAAALAMNERATRYFQELGMREYTVENEVEAALILARTGDVTGGRQRLAGLLDQVAESGSAELWAQVRLGLARLEWRAGRPGPAREHARAGLAAPPAEQEPPSHLTALLLSVLAQADAAEGLPDDALRRLDHPAVHLVLAWETPVAAGLAVVVAGAELARARPCGAARLLGAATALRGAEDSDDLDARGIARRASAALGAAGFAAAHAAGSALSGTAARSLVTAAITAPGHAPGHASGSAPRAGAGAGPGAHPARPGQPD